MTRQIPELLTTESKERFNLFPIKYHDMWEMYKRHEAAMWTAEEIDMAADKKEWQSLDKPTRLFIENILAFFASSDSIVLENLIVNFSQEIQIPEARCFYGFQGMIENIHNEVYNLMIDVFIEDHKRKDELFKGMDTIPCVKRKAEWALHWIGANAPLAKRLFAFGIVEGLMFSGSFCAVFWLKEKGKLVNSLGKSNEWISRDESLHTEFAVLLYKYIENRISEEEARSIMEEAVSIEEEFICESISVDMIGMSCELMRQYIRYVADRLMVQFGYEKIYFESNPFPFMQKISLEGKTNYFEQRVSEYNLASSCNGESLFALDNLDEIIF
jgi:ribonucleoside-diphosphate reductase beta chain